MAAELKEDYALSPTELPPSSNTFPATHLDAVAFQYDIITGIVSKIEAFTSRDVLTVPKCGKADFQFYAVAPRFGNNGMYLFGELDKFVPVSEQRFVDFDEMDGEVYFRLAGVPGEVVDVSVYDGKRVTVVSCVIRNDYSVELRMAQSKFTCV